MRVTEKTIFDNAARSAGSLRERLQRAVNENATGLRVQHPWDDPGVTAPIVGHRLSQSRNDALGVAAQRADDEIQATDSALGALTDTLSRARQLAMQMANDSYGPSDRAITSEEVRALFRDSIGLLNTRIGNRYVFAGFQDDAPAFDENGVYQGDAGVRQVEAFNGVMQSVSLRGDVVATGATGGPDWLGTLSALQTAMTGNDVAGIRATLDQLDDGIEHLSTSRAQLGAASNTLNVAVNTARENVDTEKANISRLSEADIFESATKLALAQRALEAALTASARSFDLSLLDKLR
ncbi:MAG TPA: flagellin [Polyangia bacterium]